MTFLLYFLGIPLALVVGLLLSIGTYSILASLDRRWRWFTPLAVITVGTTAWAVFCYTLAYG